MATKQTKGSTIKPMDTHSRYDDNEVRSNLPAMNATETRWVNRQTALSDNRPAGPVSRGGASKSAASKRRSGMVNAAAKRGAIRK